MNIMSVLHSKHAFSGALEGVASTHFFARSVRISTTSFLLCECSQLIACLICKILQALMCTQQLKYLGAFTFALFHYSQGK